MTQKNDPTVIDIEPKRGALPVLEIGEPERALAAYLEIDLNAALPVLKQRLRGDSRTALLTEISMGLRLMAVKAQLPHGEFGDVLIELEINERTARSAMQIARAFAAEGDARRREQILELGKAKGMYLLATDAKTRDQILSDPELTAQAAEATTRELERRIKSLEGKLTDATKALNDAQQINQGLTKKKLKSDLRADTQLVRDECLHQAALVEYGVLTLHKLWLGVDAEDHGSPEWRLRRDQVVHAVQGAAALAARVAQEIHFAAHDVKLTSEHMLSEEEVAEWETNWETIKSGRKAKDAARFDRLQQDLPRDVGRPKGSGKKGQAEA